jgi:hypothetical protein
MRSCSRDEQQSLAIFHRWVELPVRAGEKWRTPWRELIGLEPSREQDRMTSIATKLAFQLARADRGHRAKRAQTQEIQTFELLRVEGKLVCGKWSEEGACLFDPHEAARSRACSGKARGERTGRKTQARFATDRLLQPAPCLANRFARIDDTIHVKPRDSVDSDLDRRREVIKRGGDQLSQLRGGFRLRWKEGGKRAQVLSLSRCHPGQHTRRQRFI